MPDDPVGAVTPDAGEVVDRIGVVALELAGRRDTIEANRGWSGSASKKSSDAADSSWPTYRKPSTTSMGSVNRSSVEHVAVADLDQRGDQIVEDGGASMVLGSCQFPSEPNVA